MDVIFEFLREQQDAMLTMLQAFVEAESPSTDKAAVDHFAGIVSKTVQDMHGCVEVHHSERTGNQLRAEFRLQDRRTSGRILLLGHMDTVWDLGTVRRMPFRVRNGRAFGPGVFDMKGGIVVGLFAIRALQQLRIGVRKRIVLLLNGDEEIGSHSSRALTEKEARQSDCVLVLEPAAGRSGALKTARKGVGDFQISVKGQSAHAGLEPEKGASAVVELCRQILRLQDLANPRLGISVNAGMISGGTRANVVAAEAAAHVDVRVARIRDMRAVERKFRALKAFDRRTSLKIHGGFNRPPLERSGPGIALFRRAESIAGGLGFAVKETAVGGGSDGNFTAALGIPTLDGLGAVGEGAHAEHEHVIVRELPRRAALLAHLIASL